MTALVQDEEGQPPRQLFTRTITYGNILNTVALLFIAIGGIYTVVRENSMMREELRAALVVVRDEMRGAVSTVNTEQKLQAQSILNLRTDLTATQTDNTTFRSEMRQNVGNLGSDVASLRADIRVLLERTNTRAGGASAR